MDRLVLTWMLFAGCSGSDDDGDTDKVEVDTDTDADSDSDTDADADSDTDTDADADTPTGTTADTGCEPTTPATSVVPLAGFGAVAGSCGVLDSCDWGDSSPQLVRASLDFGSTAYDPLLLSAGGQQIIAEGTRGGSSVESEAIAYDFLYRCELADLLKSETEVIYLDAGGKKTDALTEIDTRRIGVSVTRALTFVSPTDKCGTPDPVAMASLLDGKLADLPLAQANADPTDAWERSILAVIACDAAHADEIEAAFAATDPSVLGDAIVVVVETLGDDAFIY